MAKKLSELPDGAGVRFKYLENSGFEYVGEVQDGRIIGPTGEKRSPTGAAREVDETIRGEDARPSGSGWSPSDWEWFSGDGWEKITTSDK